MNNTRPLLIGAVILFVVILGAGIFAYVRGKSSLSSTGAGVDTTSANPATLPSAIRGFSVVKRNFSVEGDNLGRVEIWMVKAGAEQIIGSAKLSGPSATGIGDIWTLPIPASAHGASAVFARGYNKTGTVTSKIDLAASDLAKL